MLTKKYSYGKQCIDQSDIDAVVEVLKSDWMTQGPTVTKFENELCKKFNTKYATVVSNGTASLHLIAMGLGWKTGDIIITSPITFVASSNCALYVGATPDFVDIDPVSYTIDINLLEDKIQKYRKNGKNIKAVVGVDFAGHPCEWESLRYLADKYDFQLVNDNCHALGAEYDGNFDYAAKYADAVNFSFHPVKHITTGEGGAVLTNNLELNDKVKLLRTHGITKDKSLLEKNDGPWYYEMHNLGYNYRITDFQCALGITQLKKLDYFVKKRRDIAKYYNERFENVKQFITPKVSKYARHAYHIYPLQVHFEMISLNRNEYFSKLKENGINCQVHYIPVHLQPYYKKNYGFKVGDYPNAESFYSKEVSIPIYPSLEEEDLESITDLLIKSLF
ncbi:MAG: UDP-4-amino-4,6-dideoxy-N-acetyl-beta-L-altrosamine transaminase [Ignavibacteria bacterium]|jgi:UDP-4-amino-4,6-dideoxy-N-acetyl-beta-L-altrosamine transaminase|nr:UDP-4-amino-4,6-dideoxy-N-acetyl-beta-L-altrosamine transaminase [Ignavibacteria bacterium]MCU7503723.1 UDP-4-amino-4,6-dideoxy-N-acetyl-beta-L-altrosamine transaminase [Ignavibacteria bacterium]MCU7517631.1 UDP-4-amino-4,6-dideoxy-N-acetyl-beta-L-altrosamine transaminase [Ignavibacteria bacterium]